jgi:GWxTD domain-containing protein
MKILSSFLSFFLLLSPLLSISVKDLPPKYRKWLEEEVVYIITKAEREVFLKLQTDRERDIFIEAFWKQRDPIPETPENEFKIEHYRRLDYANRRFQFGKPGWMTDRGRIYIILGEPKSIESFVNNKDFRDVEIWFYQNENFPGLPPAFNIVFYKESVSSDFKLYSPINDGPQALLVESYKDYYTGYEDALQKLFEINPTVANVARSLIPGESSSPTNTPSMASEILLANVQSFPQRLVSDKYAREFLKYKDIVEVDYTANYVDSSFLVKTIKNKGIYFVHYLIQPKRFTFHKYEEKVIAKVTLNGRVYDLKNNTIYQFDKNYSFNFDEEKIKEIGNKPITISDLFPLIPGNYKFSLIMKNTVSKEFSSFETDILIPETVKYPRLDSFIISYAKKSLSSGDRLLRPFQIGNIILLSDAEEIFSPSETLNLFLQFSGLENNKNYKVSVSILDNDKIVKELNFGLKVFSGEGNFNEEIPLAGISPSIYKLKVSLLDEAGNEILSEFSNLQLTHLPALPRPVFYYKGIPDENSYIDFLLGNQFYNKGNLEEAFKRLNRAYNLNKNNEDIALSLARILDKLGRSEEVISILTPFYSKENVKYDTYFLMGEAYRKKGDFQEAIKAYSSALSHYGHNINLLNALGECYWQIKDFKNAKFYWSKSLELNPEQKDIRKKMDEIK